MHLSMQFRGPLAFGSMFPSMHSIKTTPKMETVAGRSGCYLVHPLTKRNNLQVIFAPHTIESNCNNWIAFRADLGLDNTREY